MKLLKLTKTFLPVAMLITVLLLTGCSNAKKIEKAFVLSETEFTMMAGETKVLTLDNPKNEDVGEYTLAWMTEDSSVATVEDDGTVTAVAPGSTKIMAVVRTGKAEVYFDSTVTVTQNTTPLSSLSFNANVYSLGEGQTLNLKEEVAYYPTHAANRTLKWTSSNTDIATVSNGIVVPVSQGISTITVSTEDGAITASCTVHVSEISVDPTGISFEKEEYSVAEGETLQLTATVEPENATGYSILWNSSDPKVATVSGGIVKGVAEGEVTITAHLNVSGRKMLAECRVIVDPAESVSVPATKVQLNPSSMIITENAGDGPFKFDLTVSPANYTDRPVWSTSHPEFLKINKSTGEFTLIKAPTDRVFAVVTCTVGQISTTGVVQINPRKPKLVIELSDSSPETLYSKAPYNVMVLVAAYMDSDDLPRVTWSSSKDSVATVDQDGVVTGHTAGQCTITAVSKTDSSVKATYTVTVQKAPYVSLKVGETVTIDPSLIPKNDVAWQCSPIYLELDTATMTVKGLKESFVAPQKISGYSASTGNLYTIDVYILPKQ